ncbi:fluoride efflux transporter CrcB [Gordonia sp. HY285]|uniref:fluoride efflux transporter CrcB n=1 Tax=Gordonia liuliyuniae TaxID=2911517 RepID=UPI001F00E59C|nr:fluoride efflux transporter CrcB [Gordonia liuliyuniae]MCF8609446.1 fluoride efflux transporter CrcB [Gordonia liuliyuniae]
MADRASRGSDLALVFVGGAAGTGLRWLAEQAWPAHDGQWPVGTFVVNVTGAFVLGVLLETLVRLGPDDGARRRFRLAVGTGFCGAFTTYSAFALELSLLGKGGHVALALLYALVSVCVGIVAAWAGMRVARRVVRLHGGAV